MSFIMPCPARWSLERAPCAGQGVHPSVHVRPVLPGVLRGVYSSRPRRCYELHVKASASQLATQQRFGVPAKEGTSLESKGQPASASPKKGRKKLDGDISDIDRSKVDVRSTRGKGTDDTRRRARVTSGMSFAAIADKQKEKLAVAFSPITSKSAQANYGVFCGYEPQWFGVMVPLPEARKAVIIGKWLKFGATKNPLAELPDGTKVERPMEIWTPTKKVKAVSLTTGRMGTKSVAFRNGAVVLFRTIMDNALGKYIYDACQHGYTMRKGLTARVLGYMNETELNGHKFPLACPDEFIEEVKTWLETEEVWDYERVYFEEYGEKPKVIPKPKAKAKSAKKGDVAEASVPSSPAGKDASPVEGREGQNTAETPPEKPKKQRARKVTDATINEFASNVMQETARSGMAIFQATDWNVGGFGKRARGTSSKPRGREGAFGDGRSRGDLFTDVDRGLDSAGPAQNFSEEGRESREGRPARGRQAPARGGSGARTPAGGRPSGGAGASRDGWYEPRPAADRGGDSDAGWDDLGSSATGWASDDFGNQSPRRAGGEWDRRTPDAATTRDAGGPRNSGRREDGWGNAGGGLSGVRGSDTAGTKSGAGPDSADTSWYEEVSDEKVAADLQLLFGDDGLPVMDGDDDYGDELPLFDDLSLSSRRSRADSRQEPPARTDERPGAVPGRGPRPYTDFQTAAPRPDALLQNAGAPREWAGGLSKPAAAPPSPVNRAGGLSRTGEQWQGGRGGGYERGRGRATRGGAGSGDRLSRSGEQWQSGGGGRYERGRGRATRGGAGRGGREPTSSSPGWYSGSRSNDPDNWDAADPAKWDTGFNPAAAAKTRDWYEQNAGNPSTAWYGGAADDDLWQLSYDDLELPGTVLPSSDTLENERKGKGPSDNDTGFKK